MKITIIFSILLCAFIFVIFTIFIIQGIIKIKDLRKEKQEIEKEVNQWIRDISSYKEQEEEKKKSIQELSNNLIKLQLDMQNILFTNKKVAEDAFNNYEQVLDRQYQEIESNYDEQVKVLEDKIEEYKQDLDKIASTRAATYEALRREQQIEENKDNFRLNLNERAIRDIKLLKSIKDELSSPITVDKIIWSNYYQPLAKVQFPKIVGKATACGIYKITNLETKEAYIGQSVDVVERWKQHCKNALGVGTSSATNKLYSSMQKYGLYNFTFELLEECKSTELDEKEKFYISLYDTYNFGLNSTKGNS